MSLHKTNNEKQRHKNPPDFHLRPNLPACRGFATNTVPPEEGSLPEGRPDEAPERLPSSLAATAGRLMATIAASVNKYFQPFLRSRCISRPRAAKANRTMQSRQFPPSFKRSRYNPSIPMLPARPARCAPSPGRRSIPAPPAGPIRAREGAAHGDRSSAAWHLPPNRSAQW